MKTTSMAICSSADVPWMKDPIHDKSRDMVVDICFSHITILWCLWPLAANLTSGVSLGNPAIER